MPFSYGMANESEKEITTATVPRAERLPALPPQFTPIPLRVWREQIGKSAVTVWSWRRRGWLRTINICGRPYILPADAEEFMRRAAAGEFSREPAGAAKRKEAA
jgi:hypothetical protein